MDWTKKAKRIYSYLILEVELLTSPYSPSITAFSKLYQLTVTLISEVSYATQAFVFREKLS
jgi:hypothetical protein